MNIEDEIRQVAEDHMPDGGYGDTAWNPDTKTVLWVPADWTEIEEEAAAHDAFLDIPGVESVEGDAEQGVPKDKPWVRIANIFDPIQPTLDQRVFDGVKPKLTIAHFITEKFFSTMDDLLIDNAEEYFDLALTGSLTTYQYGDSNDCDISVFVHYDDLMDELGYDTEGEVRRELIHIVTTELDGTPLPGSQHPLQFFIIPPGNTIYNYFRPGMRSGYSFNDKGWIVPPEKKRVHDIASEMPDVYSRAAQMADKLKVLLDSQDIEAARDMFAQIHKKRGDDEMAGLGDFSEGNIVYKYLLHEGLFDRLRQEAGVRIAKTAALSESQQASLDELPEDGSWISHSDWRDALKAKKVTVSPATREKLIDLGLVEKDYRTEDEQSKLYLRKTAEIEKDGEREPIYYDFDRDKIIAKHDFEMARAGKIIGEYDGKDVYLHGTSREWINPNYFKRLWVATWPTKPLDRIHMDGSAINTRPADAMTYTQKLPWLVKSALFRWYDNQPNYGGVPDEAYPWIYSPTLGLVMGEEGSTHPFIMDHEEPRLNQDDPAKLIYGRVWPEGSHVGKAPTEAAEPFGSIYSYSWNSPEQIAQAKQAVEGYFNKIADYDAPIENPVNYQHTPLVRQEIEGYESLPAKQMNKFRNRAKSFNIRARNLGNEGRVKGRELYGLTQRYQGQCAYCNRPGADTYDHVIPLKNGGVNDVTNLLPVHYDCNQSMNTWDLGLTPEPQTFNMSPKWVGPDYQAEAHVASDPYRDGKDWKKWIKNEGIIVDFRVGDEKDDPVEGRVKEINKDSVKIEIEPGEFRTFDDDFLKQIKFKVRDDKKSLSSWKEASSFNADVGDCPNKDCDYEYGTADRYDIELSHGWFTCPQCQHTTNVRTELGRKTSAR